MAKTEVGERRGTVLTEKSKSDEGKSDGGEGSRSVK
jgi:hypothetical protein